MKDEELMIFYKGKYADLEDIEGKRSFDNNLQVKNDFVFCDFFNYCDPSLSKYE